MLPPEHVFKSTRLVGSRSLAGRPPDAWHRGPGVASQCGLRDHQGASDHGVRFGQPVETRGHVGSDPGLPGVVGCLALAGWLAVQLPTPPCLALWALGLCVFLPHF